MPIWGYSRTIPRYASREIDICMDDAIFAMATPLNGAIAIIRVSGAGVLERLAPHFGGRLEHARISHGLLQDAGGGTVDDCMAAYFAAPRSYTGEDMIELYIHGSAAVAQAASDLLLACGFRQANPGEFTKRAFLNGKLDITRAEAVMDLISAKSRRSANSALLALGGALWRRVSCIYDSLLNILAELNAGIDYPDEFDDRDSSDISAQLASLCADMDALIDTATEGRILREGALVVIVGRPNAGKSTLLNALLGSDRAIVTPQPGTTRDIIVENTVIEGCPIRLVDTAGLRSNCADEAERQGMERAKQLIDDADLLIIAIDAQQGDDGVLQYTHGRNRIVVRTKADLLTSIEHSGSLAANASASTAEIEGAKACGMSQTNAQGYDTCRDAGGLLISAKTGQSMRELRGMIASALNFERESQLTVNSRQRDALVEAKGALDDARRVLGDDELVATDIRAALLALGRITGRDCDEGAIDRIFERFCVGK